MTRGSWCTICAQDWLSCCQLSQIAFKRLCWLRILRWSSRVWIACLFSYVFSSMRRISITIKTSDSWATCRVDWLRFLDLWVALASRADSLVPWATKTSSQGLNSFVICLSHDVFNALTHLAIVITGLLASLPLTWEWFAVIRVDLSRIVVFGEHAHASWASRLVWLSDAVRLVLVPEAVGLLP